MADGTAPFIDTAQRPDPARLERQLAMLDALAAAGVQAAREVGRQAEAQQSSAAEISLAYARVSRAVRLAILLQTQLVEEAQTRQAASARPSKTPRTSRAKPARPASSASSNAWPCRPILTTRSRSTASCARPATASTTWTSMAICSSAPSANSSPASARTSTSPPIGPPSPRNCGRPRRCRAERWAGPWQVQARPPPRAGEEDREAVERAHHSRCRRKPHPAPPTLDGFP